MAGPSGQGSFELNVDGIAGHAESKRRAVEIIGRSERNVDRVNWEDDYLDVESILKLVARLEETAVGEQFLFREVELDCVFRQADGDLNAAKRSGNAGRIVRASRVRALVFEAHDLVGLQALDVATKKLHDLLDLVMGVENLDALAEAEEQPTQ